jgi:hypothetical protein
MQVQVRPWQPSSFSFHWLHCHQLSFWPRQAMLVCFNKRELVVIFFICQTLACFAANFAILARRFSSFFASLAAFFAAAAGSSSTAGACFCSFGSDMIKLNKKEGNREKKKTFFIFVVK